MTGLELLKAPGTTAGEIVDIIAEHCPPITPEHCDKLSCRSYWLAWLTTGEPLKVEGPSGKQTAPCLGVSQEEQLPKDSLASERYRFDLVIKDDQLPELKRLMADAKRIGFMPAVELSYIKPKIQRPLLR